MDDSDDKVKCTICKTTPAAPRLFPCGHVICAKCLAQLISNRYSENGDPTASRHTQCPTCRKSFEMPSGGLERLPMEDRRPTETSKPTGGKIPVGEGGRDRAESALRSISFTESSRNMIPNGRRGSLTDGSKVALASDDSRELDSSSDSSVGAVPGDGGRKMDELPVVDAVVKQSEVFTSTLSMDVNGLPRKPAMGDLVGGRPPLRSTPNSAPDDGPFDDDYEGRASEGESSFEEETPSGGSTEVNNLCSICRLGQRYVSAAGYCISCGCLVCAGCSGIHQEHAPDREHVLARLTDDNLRTVLCRSHDQLIRFFCMTCCVPVCKACLAEQHAQHRMTDYTTASRVDEAVRSLGGHVKTVLKELRAQKRGLAKAYELTELNRRETNTLILRSIDGHIRYLQEKRQELVDSSDRYHGLVKERMNAVERQVDRATAVMQDIQLKVDTSTYPLPPHGHVVPAVFPINVIQRRFSGVRLPVRDHRDFGVTDCKYTPGAIPDPGRLNTGVAVTEAELSELGDAKRNRSFRVKVLWNKAVEARDAHFLPDSKDLLFTDVGNGHTIHKLNCDGKLAPLMVGLSGFAGRQCTFGLNRYTGYKVIGYKPEPRATDVVLTVFDGDAAGTDVNLIGATFPPGYDTLVGLTATLGGLIVAVLSDGADDPTKTAICCFDQGGHLLWLRNTSPSSRAGDLVDPRFVAVDKLDRLIVTDRGGSKVNIYTSDGSHLLSFPCQEQGTPRVTPSGVCLDSRGRILVSFEDLKVVSLFTANGNFIRHVVQTVGPPLAITLCDEDKYLVVAVQNHGLWLYSLVDFD